MSVAAPTRFTFDLDLGRQFDELRAGGTDPGPLSEEAAVIMTARWLIKARVRFGLRRRLSRRGVYQRR